MLASIPPHGDGLLEALTFHDGPRTHPPCLGTFPPLPSWPLTLLIRPGLYRRPTTTKPCSVSAAPPQASPLPHPAGRSDPTLSHREPLMQGPMLILASGLNSSGGGGEGLLDSNRFQLLGSPNRGLGGGRKVRLSPSPALCGQHGPHPLTSFCQKALATQLSLSKFQSPPSPLTVHVKY